MCIQRDGAHGHGVRGARLIGNRAGTQFRPAIEHIAGTREHIGRRQVQRFTHLQLIGDHGGRTRRAVIIGSSIGVCRLLAAVGIHRQRKLRDGPVRIQRNRIARG